MTDPYDPAGIPDTSSWLAPAHQCPPGRPCRQCLDDLTEDEL